MGVLRVGAAARQGEQNLCEEQLSGSSRLSHSPVVVQTYVCSCVCNRCIIDLCYLMQLGISCALSTTHSHRCSRIGQHPQSSTRAQKEENPCLIS